MDIENELDIGRWALGERKSIESIESTGTGEGESEMRERALGQGESIARAGITRGSA